MTSRAKVQITRGYVGLEGVTPPVLPERMDLTGERMAKPLKLESLSSRKMNFNLNSRMRSRLYEMQKPDSNTQKVILSVTTNRIPPFVAIIGQLTKSVGLPRNPSSVGSTF